MFVPSSVPCVARANSNIALVKYWGKRDPVLNLPAAGSISMTLHGLETRTSVWFNPELETDVVELNHERLPHDKAARLSTFIDRIRTMSGVSARAHIKTVNDFPTAAGLASSASGFAALALAATQAAGMTLPKQDLSILSRIGSGSAARSVYGGFVEMHAGTRDDGQDAFAVPLFEANHWDLKCLVAVCAQGPKAYGSTEAMEHTSHTSPFYQPWIDDVPQALRAARQALGARDFEALAHTAEASCLRMHASAMAAYPGILYWKGATVDLIHSVRAWRAQGLAAFFTIDAGPHVKVFCEAEDAAALKAKLIDHPGVLDVIEASAGRGAELVS